MSEDTNTLTVVELDILAIRTDAPVEPMTLLGMGELVQEAMERTRFFYEGALFDAMLYGTGAVIIDENGIAHKYRDSE